MRQGKLKLAILTGKESEATCAAISALAGLPNVEIRGILHETQTVSFKRRLRNLRRSMRREGFFYLYFRFVEMVQEMTERLASRVVRSDEVFTLLRRSFPERPFRLADLHRLHGLPIQEFASLNSEGAVEALRRLGVDVGIVLGTRVLKRSTFSVPRLGCINLHKGKVPEYRGLPPGFWEIYDGQIAAGVTVHYVDDGLDTGDILGEDSVPIHPKDTPQSLRKKLDALGNDVLTRCVVDLEQGRAARRSQPPSKCKPRNAPTRRQRRELENRLRLTSSKEPSWPHILKTFFHLMVYYAGLFHAARAWRRLFRAGQSCTLLYHRVNDWAEDPLTTGVERFAEHLLLLRKYYNVIPTSDLVAKVTARKPIPHQTVTIHFDDCYRDIYAKAAPMLAQLGFPACSFISSGYVDTERVFDHDAEKCPFQLENLRSEEVRDLIRCGFEVGSHTVNHVDLGKCNIETAGDELRQSKRDLEHTLGRPVTLFSFPFGGRHNIRPEILPLVRQEGYEAMFSAYGGNTRTRSDVFDLPRVGMSGEFRPIDLLMKIEGFSFATLRKLLSGSWSEPHEGR